MLFDREQPEAVRIVVKAVRPSDSTKIIVYAQFAKCLGVAENDPKIIGAIIAEINRCAIPVLEGQRHNEGQVFIDVRLNDALRSPGSSNLKFLGGNRRIHTTLLIRH